MTGRTRSSERAARRGPQDALVDRRSFLARMGALSAAAAVAGCAPATAGSEAGAASSVAGSPPGIRPEGADLFFRSLPRPDLSRTGMTDPAEFTAWEAAALIRDDRLGVLEYTDAFLTRIQRWDGVYQAFNEVTDQMARARARSLDGTPVQGILHGIPLAVKDNIHTAGVRTTANSHIFKDFLPDRDATLVGALMDAGALMLGKSQLGPLATTRALTPDGEVTTLNAWAPGNPDVSPGGSSSGSATAVMARLAPVALGTQTGGSITMPSRAQGTTGLKPTFGRVSLDGVIPLSYTRDHVGPMTRDGRDAAMVLQAMAGEDPRDPRTLGLPPVPDFLTAATPMEERGRIRVRWGTRLGIPPGWSDGGDDGGRNRQDFLREVESTGVEVVEIPLPEGWDELTSGALNAIRLVERAEPFLPYFKQDVRLFGVTLTSFIQGLFVSGDEYLKGQRAKLALLRLVLDDILSRCDVVALETHVPFDMIGLPLLALPVGRREVAGVEVPDGVLLGGAPFGEERLLAVAAAFQARTDWHRRRPADPTLEQEARVSRPGVRGRLDLDAVAREAQ